MVYLGFSYGEGHTERRRNLSCVPVTGEKVPVTGEKVSSFNRWDTWKHLPDFIGMFAKFTFVSGNLWDCD